MAPALWFLVPVIALAASGAQADELPVESGVSLFAFGARMTENEWEQIATFENTRFVDAYIAGLGAAKRLGSYRDQADFEAEAQLMRHFGEQHHFELNALGVARWKAFPWRERVRTTAAFGLGLSLATQRPDVEKELNGDTAPLLIYWMAELEAGPADSPLSVFARIHHRSTGFGLMAEEGGSNWLGAGVRWRM